MGYDRELPKLTTVDDKIADTLKTAKDYADSLLPFEAEGWELLWSGQATSLSTSYTLAYPITYYDEIMVCALETVYNSGIATTVLPASGFSLVGGYGNEGTSWRKVDTVIVSSGSQVFNTQISFDTPSTFTPVVSNAQQYVSAVYGKKAYSGGGGGGIEEAPSDNKIYGRRNGRWVAIGVNGGGVTSPDWNNKIFSASGNTGYNSSETFANLTPDYSYTATQDCWAVITANAGSWNGVSGNDSFSRTYIGLNGNQFEYFATSMMEGENFYENISFGPIFLNEGDIIDIRTSKFAAVGYSFGSYIFEMYGLKPADDMKADKFYRPGTIDKPFPELAVGDFIHGKIIIPETLANPTGLGGQIRFNQLEPGGLYNAIFTSWSGESRDHVDEFSIWFKDAQTEENTYFYDTTISPNALITEFELPSHVTAVEIVGAGWEEGNWGVNFIAQDVDTEVVTNLVDVYNEHQAELIDHETRIEALEENNGFPAPDYAKAETINRISTNGGTWTVDRDGYVYCWGIITTNGTTSILINEKIVAISGMPINNQFGTTLPVTVGDVVKIAVDTGFVNCSCYYIPPKGGRGSADADAKADKFLLDLSENKTFFELEVGDKINGKILIPETITTPVGTIGQTVMAFNQGTNGSNHSINIVNTSEPNAYYTIYFIDRNTNEQTFFFDSRKSNTALIREFTLPDYVTNITLIQKPLPFGAGWANGFVATDVESETMMNLIDVYEAIPTDKIPVYTTAEFQAGIADGSIARDTMCYVSDENTLVYVKSDGTLATLSYTFPDGTEPYMNAQLMFLMLYNHQENDKGYWQTLLAVQNKVTANQALLTAQQTQLNDLLVRVSQLENAPIEAPPTYDMANPTVLKTPPLLGLLGLEIGGTNLIGNGWTAPADGKIVIDGASTIGLLTPTWIAVNDEKVDPSNPLAVLTLIGGGSSGEFTVNANDVITESGMGNVTYYQEI